MNSDDGTLITLGIVSLMGAGALMREVERGQGGARSGSPSDPIRASRKSKLLLAAVDVLADDDYEFVEGGCGDVNAVLDAYARAIGLNGIQIESGTAQRLPGLPKVMHAWLRVDGKILDPVWVAIFGSAVGAQYQKNNAIFGAVCDTYLLDPEEGEMRGHLQVVHEGLLARGWDLPPLDLSSWPAVS